MIFNIIRNNLALKAEQAFGPVMKLLFGGANMPWGDRTGPLGLGPRTGWGLGYCSGYAYPGYLNPVYPYAGYGRGRGWGGRGPGRGMGFGFGWGRGWGRAGFFPSGYYYPWAYPPGINYPPYSGSQPPTSSTRTKKEEPAGK